MYLKLGAEHISDLAGYDHILFITALCAIYQLAQWKKILILVTAFTIGHSITLVLATLGYIPVSTDLIEFLIPITILITSLLNIIKTDQQQKKLHYLKYAMALFFGLIHGIGFSSYLRKLLSMEEDIVSPLFAFNIGLEIGQIAIVTGVLLLNLLIVKVFSAKQEKWNMFLSGAVAGISGILIIERFPW